MKLLNLDFEQMTQSLIETALWSSSDSKSNQADESLQGYTVDEDTQALLHIEGIRFVYRNKANVLQYLEHPGMGMASLGHDLWLTAQGHGTGFWDRDLPGNLGDALTEASKDTLFVNDLYLGDDNKVYLA